MNDDKFTNLTDFDIFKFDSDSKFSHKEQTAITFAGISLLLGMFYAQINDANINEEKHLELQHSISILEDKLNRLADFHVTLKE